MQQRLFCPTLSPGSVLLSPEESHHAVGSRRARVGDKVVLFDGMGRESDGQITRIDRRQVCVEVKCVTERPFELLYRITLAVAMGRAHRHGYLIEKCTELGVSAIWPVIAERSVSKPDLASIDKWSRRAVEAAKQSGRAWVPQVAHPQLLGVALDRTGEFNASGVTQTDQRLTPFASFLAAQPAGSAVLVWVGPEGGWSDSERQHLELSGAVPVTLGPTVLRTETAAVAVIAAAAMLGGAPEAPS
jgi:16S rRNA (uracil1498-N3)-methyltransferase